MGIPEALAAITQATAATAAAAITAAAAAANRSSDNSNSDPQKRFCLADPDLEFKLTGLGESFPIVRRFALSLLPVVDRIEFDT